jgi:hypothetical protein
VCSGRSHSHCARVGNGRAGRGRTWRQRDSRETRQPRAQCRRRTARAA